MASLWFVGNPSLRFWSSDCVVGGVHRSSQRVDVQRHGVDVLLLCSCPQEATNSFFSTFNVVDSVHIWYSKNAMCSSMASSLVFVEELSSSCAAQPSSLSLKLLTIGIRLFPPRFVKLSACLLRCPSRTSARLVVLHLIVKISCGLVPHRSC